MFHLQLCLRQLNTGERLNIWLRWRSAGLKTCATLAIQPGRRSKDLRYIYERRSGANPGVAQVFRPAS